MDQLEQLQRHFRSLGVEVRAVPLRRPRPEEVPAHLLLALEVEQDDAPVLALDLPLRDVPVPVVELAGVRQAPLQGDVGVLREARQLADGRRLVALAVLDGVVVGAEPGALGEPALPDSIDLDREAEATVRIDLLAIGHGLPLYSSTSGPPGCWMILKTTNSAGVAGKSVTLMISCPSAITAGVFNSSSTWTMNASSGVV